MSTRTWIGSAPAVAQVSTLTPGGTIEATDVFSMTIGNKTLSVVAGGTTVAAVCDAIVAAWPTGWQEFDEITATDSTTHVTLTAKTAGVPFTVTVATTETGGGAADDQTFATAVTTANSSPNDWATAANWSGGAVPVNADDVVFEDSLVDCLYGLDQSAVTVATLVIKESFTGTIGLPRTNANGYVEYRATYLAIGATLCEIRGESGRIKLNFGTVQTACFVNSPGTPADSGVPAILLKGTHASNTLTINRGSVGVAFYAGETAVVATLSVGSVDSTENDADVTCGVGVTLTTVIVAGGRLLAQSAITTLSQTEGEVTFDGAAAIATLESSGGVMHYNSSGTITAAYVDGELEFTDANKSRTVTNCYAYNGAIIRDPAQTVTWTNGISLVHCGLGDVQIDVGQNAKLTPTYL